MGKLELVIMAGEESKDFLANLTKQLDRMEKLQGKKAVEDDEPEADESDEDETPKPKKGKAKKADEDDEAEDEVEAEDDEPEADADDEDEDEEPAPKKKGKAKKLTVDDVNDACKARAAATGGKKGREEVLAILKKKFKTTSVADLEPEDYAKCIALMAVDDE